MSLEAENEQPSAGSSPPELRTISDARTLKALAHPVRVALMEALVLGGPMTATQVGEQIGESPTTCSFHLRQLAKYGFVEEAGGGKGRARPWRMTAYGMNMSTTTEDPVANIAANTLARMARERYFARLTNWLETRGSYPVEWQRAAMESDHLIFATADELDRLADELNDLLRARFGDRIRDPSTRPAGAIAVEALMFTFPVELPGDGEAVR
jgi:DNA-binding transcriptional ArsR family regulator